MRIYLVGYMGSGKTTIGKKLAAAMRYSFMDTDEEIEKHTGQTIGEIFEKHGEDFFRRKENKFLHETQSLQRAVIATGGGTPCFNDLMQWMNENGITIYFEAAEGLLFHRLATGKNNRPLISKLSDLELLEHIQIQLQERKKIYEQAQIKISSARATIPEIKEKIKKMNS